MIAGLAPRYPLDMKTSSPRRRPDSRPPSRSRNPHARGVPPPHDQEQRPLHRDPLHVELDSQPSPASSCRETEEAASVVQVSAKHPHPESILRQTSSSHHHPRQLSLKIDNLQERPLRSSNWICVEIRRIDRNLVRRIVHPSGVDFPTSHHR